jgi:hypothetical protein
MEQGLGQQKNEKGLEVQSTESIQKEDKKQKEKQKEKQKITKEKSERVKEGVHLLKQLLDAGVKRSGSFEDLKKKIDEWILSGEAWAGKVRFEEYGRVAEVVLPSKSGVTASLVFRIQK